jgi:hypothetical protein
MSRAMPRIAVLLSVAALLVAAPVALAQSSDGGNGAFGPLPQPAPAETATPTPPPTVEAQQDTDRTLLFAIGAALLVLFVVIARFITRDARHTLRSEGIAEGPRLRDQGPHRHARQAKAKARAKTKAQRRARRRNR